MDTLLAGLMGILGGIVSGLVVSILSQRKNQAEIKRIEAETKKINSEIETAQIKERKGILSTIHGKMHTLLGMVEFIGRKNRGMALLDDKSDDYIRGLFEDSEWSKFEIEELIESKDKPKTYQETEIWHEYIELVKARNAFQDYIVEKEILLDDDELLGLCKDLNVIMDMFVEAVRSFIRHDHPHIVFPELYELYIPNEVEPLQKKIDEHIKSQLRSKSNM